MGLFKKRTRRSTRRAEAKALKHKAALEAKLGAKNDRKRLRAERRAADKIAGAQVATLKAQEKAALKTAEKASRQRVTVGQVKKYLGVARVLAPVLIPLVYRGATFARGQIDAKRARQLGVGVDQLADFTGHGARLTARIANADAATSEILAKRPNDADAKAFADTNRDRLGSLDTAIRAAEQMPSQQRKAAHAAIATELTGIEADLLSRLGVSADSPR